MTFIELFAGIGGFRYGLEQANQNRSTLRGTERRGIQPDGDKPNFKSRNDKQSQTRRDRIKQQSQDFACVWANEIDKYACQVYRRNFQGGSLYEGDIREVKTDNIPYADLLTAGFPCQAFSIAGKRKGFDDTRGTLFFEIARICRAKKPRYILLENVKGLLNHQSGQTFQTILKVLADIGYVLQWEVLNSKNFGVPQNRERVFIVGYLRGTSRPEVFPIGRNDKEYDGTLKEKQRSRSRVRVSNYAGSLRAKETKSGCDTVIKEDDMKIRRLTPTECERLQGFPDGWTEGVSGTQRYKMLGNAVTTNVITEIGKRL